MRNGSELARKPARYRCELLHTNFATLLNSPCQQLNRPFPSCMRIKKVIFISVAWYLATLWNRGLGNSEIAYCNHTSKKTKKPRRQGSSKMIIISLFSFLSSSSVILMTDCLICEQYACYSFLVGISIGVNWMASCLNPPPPPVTQSASLVFWKKN